MYLRIYSEPLHIIGPQTTVLNIKEEMYARYWIPLGYQSIYALHNNQCILLPDHQNLYAIGIFALGSLAMDLDVPPGFEGIGRAGSNVVVNQPQAMGAEVPPPNITVHHFHNQYFYYYPAPPAGGIPPPPAAGGNPPPPAAVVNNALPLPANNPPLPAAALNNAPAASVDNLSALAASDDNASAPAAASDNNQLVVASPFSPLPAIESAEDVNMGNLFDGVDEEHTLVQQPPVQQPQNVGDSEGTNPFTLYIQSP